MLLLLLGCQMVSATLLGSVLEPTFGTAGLLIGSVFEITIFFTFAEVAPKTYAVTHPERAVLRMSGLLYFVTHFAPLRILTRGFIGLANIVLPGRGPRRGARSSPSTSSSRWPTSRPTRPRSRPKNAS